MEINHRVVTRLFVSFLETMTQEEATEAIEIVVEEIEKKRPGIVRAATDRMHRATNYANVCFEDYEDWSLE